jgi:hypothetical protein
MKIASGKRNMWLILLPLLAVIIISIIVSYVLVTRKDASITDSEASSVDVNNNSSKVRIKDKKLFFNNNPFFINGVMYIGVKDRPGTVSILSTFSKEVFDIDATEKEIKDISENGYNTIRIAYNSNEDGKTAEQKSHCPNNVKYKIEDCLEKESLDNLANTIKLAEKYNIKVILSFVAGTPFRYYSSSSVPYDGQNINFLKEETINDYGRFLKDVITYLKGRQVNFNTFLAIQPYAEPSIDTGAYPFDGSVEVLSYPEFYVRDDKQYSIKNKDKKSEEIKDIYKFAVINSYNKWASDLKSVDSNINILFEQFPQYAVKNESRLVLDSVLYSEFIKAEIIGMQLYPDYIQGSTASVYELFEDKSDLQSILKMNKPFFVLEYGFLKNSSNAVNKSEDLYILNAWIDQMCNLDIVGMSLFNWNSDNFDYQTAKNNDYLIAKFVKEKITSQQFKCGETGSVSAMTPISTNKNIDGDYNQDSKVDMKDYLVFVKYMKSKNTKADLNRDGVVDIADFLVMRDIYSENRN